MDKHMSMTDHVTAVCAALTTIYADCHQYGTT